MKPKRHLDKETGQWVYSPGLNKSPYRSCLLVDCSIWLCDVPFSGPSGSFQGSPHKKLSDIMQEAVFTGHKSQHGQKVKTAFMPNGLCTMFGGVSCRLHDVSGPDSVQGMSGLGTFLKYIQLGQPALTPPYSGFGDCIYNVNMECLRTYFRAYFPRHLMTEYVIECDRRMTAVRESVEWDYAKLGNIFSVIKDPSNFKLGQQNPVSF